MSEKKLINEDILPELKIDEKESQLHRLDSLSLLLYTFLLTITVLTVWLFKHRRIRFLHETGLAIIYGLIIGAIIRYGMNSVGDEVSTVKVQPSGRNSHNVTSQGPPDFLLLTVKESHTEMSNKTLSYSFVGEVQDINEVNEIDQKALFDPEIFFNVLLPPIIFHAGYSMKKRFFFRNIGSILTFAFVGTTISTFVVGGVMYGVTRLTSHLISFSFLDSLHFGALISATDPVTVLAIFNDLNVDVNLYALVFGESVLNDAVAIVMTRTLEDYEESLTLGSSSPTYLVFLRSIWEFFGIFGASFIVGSLMACATALLTKFTDIKQFPLLESTLFVLMSYSTFLLAEVMKLTGIVSVLFCGICQAHYTYNNLSTESKSSTKQFFDLLNFMAENFIFSYIGVSMFTFPKHKFDFTFISGSFFAIILGRALNIYPLSFILNLGRKTKINFNLQHMMFLSGLRGAIAFALSIRNTLTAARQMILTTTLLIVIVTVAVCGGSTVSLLTWLGIPLGVSDDENDPISSPSHHYNTVQSDRQASRQNSSTVEQSCLSSPMSDNGQIVGTKPGKSWMAKLWSKVDDNFLKPLLTHSNPTLMETLPTCCYPIGRFLTSKEQLSRHPAMQATKDLSHNIVQDDNDMGFNRRSSLSETESFENGKLNSGGVGDTPHKEFLSKKLPSHPL